MSKEKKKEDKDKALHIASVSKSLKNKKRKLMYMGRDKWNNEVWEWH
jgi:hypothetical protein